MSKCHNCVHGVFCGIWGEIKCLKKGIRIYKDITNCEDFKATSKDAEKPECKCDDCLSSGE